MAGYVEIVNDLRGHCPFCGQPNEFFQRAYMVNYDPADPFAGALEAEFKAATAQDHLYFEDCGCTQHERISPNSTIETFRVDGKYVSEKWLSLTIDGNDIYDRQLTLRKNGRRSYRIVVLDTWPPEKIGPVYRSLKAANKAYEAAAEAIKAEYRAYVAFDAKQQAESALLDAELGIVKDAE